ncbi:Rz-like lysis system protein LysB [Ewingella americana]|uniref:Rz-like lysis system protein LysB n=1 Tax=Ewingella americana TaxID=41202 RepID=UPI0012AE031D|nr:Rz-like lysis system protein LysB [Ewingella americana]MRT03181.1 LysB family phage lysis regulatory protein [Ewingella americana]
MRYLIGLVFTVLVVFALGQAGHIKKLKREAVSNQRIIETLSAGIESRDRAITRLQAEGDERDQQGRALRESLGAANQQARDREYEIQGLLNENQTLREWFATALPPDVIRLQERPAFATPGDYLHWLSSRKQLPDPGKPSKE